MQGFLLSITWVENALHEVCEAQYPGVQVCFACRENLGKIADATQDYRQILELEPSNKAAALKLKIQSS